VCREESHTMKGVREERRASSILPTRSCTTLIADTVCCLPCNQHTLEYYRSSRLHTAIATALYTLGTVAAIIYAKEKKENCKGSDVWILINMLVTQLV
jgi:hypothetical protein